MKRLSAALFAAVIGLPLIAVPALAQDTPAPGAGPGPDRRDPFARIDTNGDGAIDQAEFLQSRQTMFQRMDANSDGNISQQEFDTVGSERFTRLDRNNDGRLTRDDRGRGRKGGGPQEQGQPPQPQGQPQQ